MIYLFSHDTRDFASTILLAREALAIERAALLLRELETDVLLVDHRWTHRTTSSSSCASEHESRGQLGAAGRSQNRGILSEGSKSRGGETLRKGATCMVPLLGEPSIALHLAIFKASGILGVFHHDTQVGSEV